jgi:hypothetical protein
LKTSNKLNSDNNFMKIRYLLTISIFCISLLPILAQDLKLDKNTKDALSKVDTARIKRDIAYLADDKLKGRLPGTEGYQMAVDYVVAQFKQAGLTPAGDHGTFLQKLILRKASINPALSSAVLRDKDGNQDTLSLGKDITIHPSALKDNMLAEAPLVFAGYGIEVPGSYSDYEGMDVKGKIVVVLSGAPKSLRVFRPILAVRVQRCVSLLPKVLWASSSVQPYRVRRMHRQEV